MDFLFETAKRNLDFWADMQKRNEAAVGAILDCATATRKQTFATAEAMLDLMSAQGNAITQAAQVNEKVMENAVRKSSEAVIKTAEKIARSQKPSS